MHIKELFKKNIYVEKQILKGSFILVISGIICKILGAFYRIPLSNILGTEGIGIYQMIFPIFSLFLILATGGVVNTMSTQIASSKAKNLESEKQIFWQGFVYCFVLGMFFSFILFVFAKYFSILQGNENGTSGYISASFALLFSSLIVPFRGYFQGLQNMTPTAISQIIEQVFKIVLGLTFAILFLKINISYSVFGAFLGIALSELFALLFLIINYIKNEKTHFNKYFKNNKILIKIIKKNKNKIKNNFFSLNFNFLLTFLIIPLITTIESFLVVNILSKEFTTSFSTSLYGLQSGMINSLINFPVIISTGISLAILPSVSFLYSKNEYEKIKENTSNIFSFLWITLLPCSLLFVLFAPEILQIIYPILDENLFAISVNLLKISAFEIIFISFMQVCISILQGLKKEKTPVWILSLSGIIKIALTIFLVHASNINIFGLAISNLGFYGFASLCLIYFVKSNVGFSLPYKTLSISVFSLALFCLEYYFVNELIFSFWLKIFISGFIFCLTYILPLIIFKIISLEKIKNYIKKEI